MFAYLLEGGSLVLEADDVGSNPSVGSPFASKLAVYGRCFVTLPVTFNETLQWLSSLPILMQNHSDEDRVDCKSFWW